MIIEKKFWLVHVYRDGKYSRTIDLPFTAASAREFCKSFNDDGAAQAVAKQHSVPIEVCERL